MDFDFLTESIKPTQTATITIDATGALRVPVGTTGQRPGSPVAGFFRFNDDNDVIEYWDGTQWVSVGSGSGSVTSVAVSGSTGLTVGGSPITTSGTITLTLDADLQAISALSSTGIAVRTAADTWAQRSIVTANSARVTVADGDGVSGNPTIDLATLSDGGTGTFLKITRDSYGRVSGTTAVVAGDITALVDSTYVNTSGDSMASAANLTFSGGGEVLGLPTVPSGSTAAASKAYVDSVSQGLDPKGSVRAATTVAGTLATSFENGDTIDGVTLSTGDRILIKNQAAPEENGIYVVAASGAPTRATDMDAWTEVPGAYTFVEEGTTYGDTGWVCSSNAGGTLNTTAITWVQFFGAGTYTAGTGLTLTGTQFSITSPIATTIGGTGLTSIGTGNQVLGVNNGATGLEYKTVSAGTGISVTHGANSITVANTGVTSVALTVPSFLSVSGSPVTTTGTLAVTLASQSQNLVFASPNGSSGTPTFRALEQADLAFLQLYKENASGPTAPVASGTNAVAIGSGANATATAAVAIGDRSDSRLAGGMAFAQGRFATDGDAQAGLYVLRNATSDATVTELFMNGSSTRVALPNNSVFLFDIYVTGRRTDATGGSAGYRFTGVMKRDGNAGSTGLVGSVSKTVIAETNTAWDATVTADTTNGSIKVEVTGEAAKSIRWVAVMNTTEVTN